MPINSPVELSISISFPISSIIPQAIDLSLFMLLLDMINLNDSSFKSLKLSIIMLVFFLEAILAINSGSTTLSPFIIKKSSNSCSWIWLLAIYVDTEVFVTSYLLFSTISMEMLYFSSSFFEKLITFSLLYPTTIINLSMSASMQFLIILSSNVMLFISRSGFGISFVRGLNLLPIPADKITLIIISPFIQLFPTKY